MMRDEASTGSGPEDGVKTPAPDQAGEDDGSTSVEGKDDHLHDDQKPLNQAG